MIKLICKRCKYDWEYKGSKDYYATCPNCLNKVKIPNDEESAVKSALNASNEQKNKEVS